MDWGTAAQWAGVAAAIVIAIWGAFSRTNAKAFESLEKNIKQDVKDMQSDMRRLFERLDKVEGRVGKVEVEIEHLPTKDEFHAVDTKITGLGAKFDAMAQRIDTLVNLYERAQDRLVEAEKR